MSRTIRFGGVIVRPTRSSAIRTRYPPSEATSPDSSRPSQWSRTSPAGHDRGGPRLRTGRPRASTIATVIRSCARSRKKIRAPGFLQAQNVFSTSVPAIGASSSLSSCVTTNAVAVAASSASRRSVGASRANAPRLAILPKVKERLRTADPYRDLAVIDSRAPRFNQATVAIVSAVAAVTGWWWLLGLLAVQLALGLTLGRRFCVPCVAYFELVQPRLGEGPLEDARPPRVANVIGLAALTASTLAYALGAASVGLALAVLVAALALIAAVTGFCAGCEAYKLVAALTGRPFVSCPIPPRPPSPSS